MKLALILNVIDPKIGGVMIMGDRGTGKSTTIRALADLLPEIGVVARDAFNSGERGRCCCWLVCCLLFVLCCLCRFVMMIALCQLTKTKQQKQNSQKNKTRTTRS